MSVCLHVQCDDCGKKRGPYGGRTAPSAGAVRAIAAGAGWACEPDGTDTCPGCRSATDEQGAQE